MQALKSQVTQRAGCIFLSALLAFPTFALAQDQSAPPPPPTPNDIQAPPEAAPAPAPTTGGWKRVGDQTAQNQAPQNPPAPEAAPQQAPPPPPAPEQNGTPVQAPPPPPPPPANGYPQQPYPQQQQPPNGAIQFTANNRTTGRLRGIRNKGIRNRDIPSKRRITKINSQYLRASRSQLALIYCAHQSDAFV